MRLTVGNRVRRAASAPSQSWRAAALITGALLVIGAIDQATGSAPVQHLYYLPIISAAIRFGRRGGVLAALAAVLLYHLANPDLLRLRHQANDVLEVLLFLIVGLVTTKLAEEAAQMRLLAHTDDLTGLHNLRSFEANLGDLIARTGNHPFQISLMVLDLDLLKRINDAHGHLAGAEAVRLVGAIIARQVPTDAVACRYGGDEFVIALPDRSVGQTVEIAESLRLAVQGEQPVLAGQPFPAGTLSISAGIASRTIAAATTGEATARLGEALFREADGALYVAKERGRNRVHAIASS